MGRSKRVWQRKGKAKGYARMKRFRVRGLRGASGGEGGAVQGRSKKRHSGWHQDAGGLGNWKGSWQLGRPLGEGTWGAEALLGLARYLYWSAKTGLGSLEAAGWASPAGPGARLDDSGERPGLDRRRHLEKEEKEGNWKRAGAWLRMAQSKDCFSLCTGTWIVAQ